MLNFWCVETVRLQIFDQINKQLKPIGVDYCSFYHFALNQNESHSMSGQINACVTLERSIRMKMIKLEYLT
jgi:hypothetical protein